MQRRVQIRAPGSIGLDAPGRQPGRQRIDGAAHFIELSDPQGIELRDFKTLAAAFGDQALAMQQMQGVADRLPGYSEFFGKLVLPDTMSRRQCAVGDGLENPRIDLIDQVGEWVERDHADVPIEYGIPNSQFSWRTRWDQGADIWPGRFYKHLIKLDKYHSHPPVTRRDTPARFRKTFAAPVRTSDASYWGSSRSLNSAHAPPARAAPAAAYPWCWR